MKDKTQKKTKETKPVEQPQEKNEVRLVKLTDEQLQAVLNPKRLSDEEKYLIELGKWIEESALHIGNNGQMVLDVSNGEGNNPQLQITTLHKRGCLFIPLQPASETQDYFG